MGNKITLTIDPFKTIDLDECLFCKYCGNVNKYFQSVPLLDVPFELEFDECPEMDKCKAYYENFIEPYVKEETDEEYEYRQRLISEYRSFISKCESDKDYHKRVDYFNKITDFCAKKIDLDALSQCD